MTNNGAEQASEIGTRLGKLVRMVRLIRLLRLTKALEKQNKGAGDKLNLKSVRKVEFLNQKKDKEKIQKSKSIMRKKTKANYVQPSNPSLVSDKKEPVSRKIDILKKPKNNIDVAPLNGFTITKRGRMSLMIRNETHRNILLRNMIKQVLKEKKEKEEEIEIQRSKNKLEPMPLTKKDKQPSLQNSTHSDKISKSPSLKKEGTKNISIEEFIDESRDISQIGQQKKIEKKNVGAIKKQDQMNHFRRQISKFSNLTLIVPEEETKIYETEKILGRISKKTDIILPVKSIAVKIWNDRIIKKLIFLVLIMNAVMTFMGADFYTNNVEPWDSNLTDLGNLYSVTKNKTLIESFTQKLEEEFLQNDYYLIGLEFSDNFMMKKNESAFANLRNNELKISYFKHDDFDIKLTLSSEKHVSFQKGLNLGGLSFIILILMTSYYCFTKDSNDLVMDPLYKVVQVLNVLLKQPLNPNINGFYLSSKYEDNLFTKNEQEYRKIVAVLCRLCWYLSICYGSKNVELITNRMIMQKKELENTELRGERVFAYYAFFEMTNLFDSLKEDSGDIYLFINNIMEILDRTTDRYKGKTEKDFINNRFLLIWYLNSKNEKDNFIEPNRNSSETATMSITNILKILIKIHKFRYSSKSELNGFKHVLDDKEKHIRRDFTNYIRITLDAGKLYQSFVGSRITFQITHYGSDLLSTKKLHKLVKCYKSPIIITSKVYNVVSETIKTFCRKIDVVKFERFGKSRVAKPLYTMDITGRKLIFEEDMEIIKKEVKKAVINAEGDEWKGLGEAGNEGGIRSKIVVDERKIEPVSRFEPDNNPFLEEYDKPPTIYEKRIAHCEIKSQILMHLRKGAKNRLFMEDSDIQLILNKKFEFRRNFRSAMDFYLLGAWDAAKEFFEKSLGIMPNDGPSLAIMSFMKKYDFIKPENWRGYRYLD